MTEQNIAKIRQAIIDSIKEDFADAIAEETAAGDEEKFNEILQELNIYTSLERLDKAIALLNKENQ
jgi:hypothetical protein